ncbi:CopD family protein, partial [bacterium]
MILSHIFYHSLVQGMDLVGMVLLAGGLTFRALVVSPSSGQASSLERLLPFLLLLIGLGDLVLRSQMISGQPWEEIWLFLPAVLFKSHFGKVWAARTFLLCVLGVVSITKIQGRITKGVAIAAGTLLLLTASLSGHAADSGDLSLAVLVDWLHLLAVSAWTGGLFFLALLLRKRIMLSRPEPTSPSALITSVKRFSTLAGICVVLILATGSYQAWHRVGGISALLQTSYGQILGVKLVLVISLLCLGALNRYRILPELSQ